MRALVRWLRRLALAGLALALSSVLGFAVADRLWPFPVERLERFPTSPRVTDRHGRLLFEQVGTDEQWRRPVPLAEISPWLVQATVAVEDERFFAHPGVDPLAIARALGQNLLAGRVVSGASTLSMQVCRMMEPRPRTLRSKVIEAFRALQLERRYGKDEILEFYLNLAPYGGNLRGAECAAEHYFGKRAADLSLGEAALLAGVPQSPRRLRPDVNPEAARKRRAVVLDRLRAAGQLRRAVHERVGASPPVLRRGPRRTHAPHAAALALARRPGGGRTTIDLDVQLEVEYLALDHARLLPRGGDLAVVVIEIASGDVLALLGSADPDDPLDGQVNGAVARRSPGSALKPFLFAAAFETRRYGAETVLEDAPLDLAGWRPANFDGGFRGPVTAAEALRRSLNVPALRLVRGAGLARCAGVLEACGVELRPDALERSGLALVTGATEVRLLDLTAAYATLGRGGLYLPPRLFVDQPRSPGSRALTPETCDALWAILSTENGAPNGLTPAPGGPSFLWKTGTSAGHRDAWAVGHDGRLAIGVWAGRFSGAGHPDYAGRTLAEPLLARLFASELVRALP